MKLSIWQQFSSNHSANFMVVGEFESVEWAETVADELQLMLADISAWWSRFDDRDDRERIEDAVKESGGLAPPEIKYKAQFGVEVWGKGTRGVSDWMQSPRASEAISTFGNLVIVNPASDTWMGPPPFVEILRNLGGKVAADCENWDDTYFAMNLTCVTPQAQLMVDETRIEDRHGTKLITLPGCRITRGELLREGSNMQLKHYQLHDGYYKHSNSKDKPSEKWNFEEELQRLLAYLESRECENITYEFLEVEYGD
ncbi:MAG: hypothetical protein RLP44_31560 [Aggregatilineales bacterium]